MLNHEKEESLREKHGVLIAKKWLVVSCFSIQASHLKHFFEGPDFQDFF